MSEARQIVWTVTHVERGPAEGWQVVVIAQNPWDAIRIACGERPYSIPGEIIVDGRPALAAPTPPHGEEG